MIYCCRSAAHLHPKLYYLLPPLLFTELVVHSYTCHSPLEEPHLAKTDHEFCHCMHSNDLWSNQFVVYTVTLNLSNYRDAQLELSLRYRTTHCPFTFSRCMYLGIIMFMCSHTCNYAMQTMTSWVKILCWHHASPTNLPILPKDNATECVHTHWPLKIMALW